MFALLYVFALYAIVDKLKLQKAAYYSIPILIIVYIALAQGCHLIGKNIPNMIYRNFLIEGFPLFMFGHLIHKNEEKLINRFSNRFLLIVITVSTLLCIAERYVLGRDFGVNICTFPQVSAIFLIAVKNRGWGSNSKLRILGTSYSLYVYVIHPFVWHTFQFIYSKLKISSNKPALYLMPIMVLVITIVLSIIVVKVIDTIKKERTVSE